MNTPQTPQEITKYKRQWMMLQNTTAIPLHDDLHVEGKSWCRRNLERHQWSMTAYTDECEHTFYFEHKEHADEFNRHINLSISKTAG